MQIDHASTRKLALVKQVYSNAALEATNRYSAGARLLAVIGFDWAAEGMIKAVLTYFKVRPAKLVPSFSDLISNADAELQNAGLGKLPDASRAEHIRKVRNAAQHEGRVPTEQELVESQVHAADFLEAVCQHVWGISFESVSMTNLIQNEAYRQQVLQAEANVQVGEYKQAAAAASILAARLLNQLQRSLLGMDEYISGDAFVRYGGTHSWGRLGEASLENLYIDSDTTRLLYQMKNTVTLSLVGANIRDHSAFLEIVGHVLFTADGKPHIHNEKANPTRSDVEFALTYATNLVIRIEEYSGDMLVDSDVNPQC